MVYRFFTLMKGRVENDSWFWISNLEVLFIAGMNEVSFFVGLSLLPVCGRENRRRFVLIFFSPSGSGASVYA